VAHERVARIVLEDVEPPSRLQHTAELGIDRRPLGHRHVVQHGADGGDIELAVGEGRARTVLRRERWHRSEVRGPARGGLGQHALRHVAPGVRRTRAEAGQHAHQVARAAAVIEQVKAAPIWLSGTQPLLPAQQPAGLDRDELVGGAAQQALDGMIEPAVVGRRMLVELGGHRPPPTMSRMRNSGRPLLWS
jgi:hypothetical protein